MIDIVNRLRDRAYCGKAPDTLCEEAANEIERLRKGAVESRETVQQDRDTFAAAALTGLLRPDDVHSEFGATNYKLRACRMAFDWADAMLRERGTNHDAAPAARADSTHERPPNVRCQQAGESRCAASGSGSGTGNTHQPNATPPQGSVQGEGSIPDSGKWNEPAAWATFYPNGSTASVYIGRVPSHAVPLYRHPQPTLNDAEREAMMRATDGYIAWMEDNVLLDEPNVQATLAALRGLLERLK